MSSTWAQTFEEEAMLEQIFQEPVGTGARILDIPAKGLEDLRTMDRQLISALSVVARNFAAKDIPSTARQRRISEDDWSSIVNSAQRLRRSMGKVENNLDYEAYLQVLSRITSEYQQIPSFSAWTHSQAKDQSQADDDTEEKMTGAGSVINFFSDTLQQSQSGMSLIERGQNLQRVWEISRSFQEFHTPFKTDLVKNPELWYRIPAEFVGTDSSASEMPERDKRVFLIYLELLESAMRTGLLRKVPEGNEINVEKLAPSHDQDAYSLLSPSDRSELKKLAEALSADKNLSRTEIKLAFEQYISLKREQARSTLPSAAMPPATQAEFLYAEFQDALKTRSPSSIRFTLGNPRTDPAHSPQLRKKSF